MSKTLKKGIALCLTLALCLTYLISANVNAQALTSSYIGSDGLTVSATAPTIGQNYTINGKSFKCIKNNGSNSYSFMSNEAIGQASYDTLFNTATGNTFNVTSTYHPGGSYKIKTKDAWTETVVTKVWYEGYSSWSGHTCTTIGQGPQGSGTRTVNGTSNTYKDITTKCSNNGCNGTYTQHYTTRHEETETVEHPAEYQTISYSAYYTYSNNGSDISGKNIANANTQMQTFLNEVSDIKAGSKGMYLLSSSDISNATTLSYAKASVGSDVIWTGVTPSSNSCYTLSSSGQSSRTDHATALNMHPLIDIDMNKAYVSGNTVTKKPTSISLTKTINDTVYNGDEINVSDIVSDVKYDLGDDSAYTVSIDSAYGVIENGIWYASTNVNTTVPITITSKNFGLTKVINVELLADFSITYNLNGGTAENPSKYQIRDDDITLNNPVKTGYTFTGWTGTGLNELTMEVIIYSGSTENKEYTANYQANNYTVTLDNVGGENGLDEIVVTYDSLYPHINTPTKTGYNFLGYFANIDDTEIQYFNANGDSTRTWDIPNDTTLYAKWELIGYTISYDYAGGVADNITNYNIEADTIEVNNPTKTGYTFTGWVGTDLDGNTMNLSVPTGSYGDRFYTSTWEANKYNVTFNDNFNSKGGQKGADEFIATYDSELPSNVTIPVRRGYDFTGYYLDNEKYYDENGNALVNVYTVPNDITLDAKYTPYQRNITFDKTGGSDGTDSVVATFDENIPAIEIPSRSGYTFLGYFTVDGTKYINADGTSALDFDETEDTTLYAHWETIKYSISYELNGGDVINPTVYDIETDTFILNNPTKIGYDFVGWTGTDVSENSMSVEVSLGSIGERSYEAHFEPIKNNISFVITGGNFGTFKAANGDIIPIGQNDIVATYDADMPQVPVPNTDNEYYEFLGYYDENGIQYYDRNGESVRTWDKLEDTTLIAKYQPIEYTITYDLGDDVTSNNNPTSYNVDTETFVLNNPTKYGYIFKGWVIGYDEENEEEILQTGTPIISGSHGDMTISGRWEVINSNIVFNLTDDENSACDQMDLDYNEELPQVGIPTRNGYTFKGYFDEEGNQYYDENGNPLVERYPLDHGITLTAKWDIINYAIDYNLDGGTDLGSATTYNVESNTFRLTNPVKQGYAFIGWTNEEVESPAINMIIGNATLGNKTFNANWVEGTNILVFDNGLGEGKLDKIDVATGYSVSNVPIPSSEGKKFLGYYDEEGNQYYDENGSGVIVFEENKDVVLIAKWCDLVTDISLNNNGGENGTNNIVIEYGKVLPHIEVPTKADTSTTTYRFLGYFDENGDRIYDAEGNSTYIWYGEKLVLTAKWWEEEKPHIVIPTPIVEPTPEVEPTPDTPEVNSINLTTTNPIMITSVDKNGNVRFDIDTNDSNIYVKNSVIVNDAVMSNTKLDSPSNNDKTHYSLITLATKDGSKTFDKNTQININDVNIVYVDYPEETSNEISFIAKYVGEMGLTVYRLYNSKNGDHIHTDSFTDKEILESMGWTFEGISLVESTDGNAIYRLYNKYSGEHFFTADSIERFCLLINGWSDEGIAFYSPSNQGSEVYRVYNTASGLHHFTKDKAERDWLILGGWTDEGIAWYEMK